MISPFTVYVNAQTKGFKMKSILLTLVLVLFANAGTVVWQTADIDSFYYGVESEVEFRSTRGMPTIDYSGIENFTMTVEYTGSFNTDFVLLNTPSGTIYWEDEQLKIRSFNDRIGTGSATTWIIPIDNRWLNYDYDSLSIEFTVDEFERPTFVINGQDVSLFLGIFIEPVQEVGNISGDYNSITVGYSKDLRGQFPVGYIAPEGSEFSNLSLIDNSSEEVSIDGTYVHHSSSNVVMNNNVLEFRSSDHVGDELFIYSLNGRLLSSLRVRENRVELTELPAGVYLVQFTLDNAVQALKISL